MTNKQGNSVGLSIMIISIITILLFTLSSCGVSNLTSEQLNHRNRINYEMDKVWTEYQFKTDSLIIEYNKH